MRKTFSGSRRGYKGWRGRRRWRMRKAPIPCKRRPAWPSRNQIYHWWLHEKLENALRSLTHIIKERKTHLFSSINPFMVVNVAWSVWIDFLFDLLHHNFDDLHHRRYFPLHQAYTLVRTCNVNHLSWMFKPQQRRNRPAMLQLKQV